jgi:hypothetical protein
MNCCGLDYATPGNHEFDVTPDQLKLRVKEAQFPILCANLVAPAGLPRFRSLAFWPKQNPFLAISGLAGEQTLKKASRPTFGYRREKYQNALRAVAKRVQAKPEIGALVLLTHMDRDEDKEVQDLLRREWRKSGGAFILGGHDHDISWQEPGRNSILCKNLSNGRTLTAVVLSKSAVAAPWQWPPRRHRDHVDFLVLEREWREVEEKWNAGTPPPEAEPLERIVDRTVSTWRGMAPTALRPDFVEAFAVQLRDTAAGMSRRMIEKEDFLQGAERLLFEFATLAASEPFLFPGTGSGVLTLQGHPDLSGLLPDADAQHRVDGWVNAMRAKAGAEGSEVLFDFSGSLPAGMRLNGQDDALRARSTDFGNFVADAVEVATGADLALINAGSFRLDDMVGPALTHRDLQETFLYDHPEAIITADLTADEVRVVCAHAQRKSGQGGFLQVSRGFESLSGRTGTIRTALVRHMLADDEDGYQSLLASSRACTAEQIAGHIAAASADGLIDLILQGARTGIAYSARDRLVATADRDHGKLARESFIACIDRYTAACRSLGEQDEGLSLLELDPDRPRLSEELAQERLPVRLLVMKLALTWGLEWVRSELYDDLRKSDMQYRRETRYHHYLHKAMMFFDFHIIHPRLRDEEGAHENPDAASIGLDEALPRASRQPAHSPRRLSRTFTELVDEYRAVCSTHNISYPDGIRMLQADPLRPPPPQSLREARFGLRHSLLFILVQYGLQRFHSEFTAGVRDLDVDTTQTRYGEHLTATLSFFDIVARYGLLVNEEATG